MIGVGSPSVSRTAVYAVLPRGQGFPSAAPPPLTPRENRVSFSWAAGGFLREVVKKVPCSSWAGVVA